MCASVTDDLIAVDGSGVLMLSWDVNCLGDGFRVAGAAASVAVAVLTTTYCTRLSFYSSLEPVTGQAPFIVVPNGVISRCGMLRPWL